MGKRVLIVDNNSIAQLIERAFLELSGLTVDCAESGETALSLIEKELMSNLVYGFIRQLSCRLST